MNKILRLLRYDLPLHFVLLFTNWLPDNTIFLRLRGYLAHFFIGSCSINLRLGRNIDIYDPRKISIGKDVYFAYGCFISGSGKIIIGDEVMFGPFCVIVAGNHQRNPITNSYRFSPPGNQDIEIGKGSWIGSHAVIAGGAIIESGVVIGANSVVTKMRIPANHLAAGAPCKVIKKY